MATNDPPIEDPYRRSRRILPTKPTRRIGMSAVRPAFTESATPAPASPASAQATAEPPLRPHPSRWTEEVTPVEAKPAEPLQPPPSAGEPEVVSGPEVAPDSTKPHRTIPPRKLKKRLADEQHRAGNSASGAITITILSAALLAYAFNIANIQASLDTAIASLNHSAQSQGPAVVPILSRAAPWLVLLPVLVLFYAIMSSLAAAIGLTRRRRQSPRQRRRRPLDEFKKSVSHFNITSRTAYQAYLLLQAHVAEAAQLQHGATLEGDLAMTPAQVREVHLALLRATGREADTAARLPNTHTVLDLLSAAENAPKQARSKLEPVFEPGDPFRKR